MSPKISVIMPTFKVEKYFEQCLVSVIDQTLRDIEIIPVDDGSPDACGAIMDAYAAKDARIKPIHQPNGGYGKAINAGLRAATGDYIAIVETDDWVEPDMLEALYVAAQENAAPIVKGSFIKHENGRAPYVCSLRHIMGSGVQTYACPASDLHFMLYESSIWTAIYRRDLLEKNNVTMLETAGAAFQDVVWKFSVYSLVDTVLLIDKPVYHYRVMAAGSSSASVSKAEAMFVNYAEIRRVLKANGKFEEFKQSFYAHQFFDFVFHSKRLQGDGLEFFREKAHEVAEEAQQEGICLDNFHFHPDVNDYVAREVKPVWHWVLGTDSSAAQCASAEHAAAEEAPAQALPAPCPVERVGIKARIKRRIKNGLIRCVRNPVNKLFLNPLTHKVDVLNWEMGNSHRVLSDELIRSKDALRGDVASVREEAHNNAIALRGDVASVREEAHNNAIALRGDVASVREEAHNNAIALRGDAASVREEAHSDAVALRGDLASVREEAHSNAIALREDLAHVREVAHNTASNLSSAINNLYGTVNTQDTGQFAYYLRAHHDEIPARIARLKSGMDAASCFQVDRYFKLFSLLPQRSHHAATYTFPLYMDIFSDEERFIFANMHSLLDKIRGDFSTLDMTEIPINFNNMYFECGLQLVPYGITGQFSGAIALDCGAWVGDSAIPIARYGFKEVHSFEPLPETFEILSRNIKKNKLEKWIKPHNLAVSETSGTLRFDMVGADGQGSLATAEGSVSCEAISIDDFCKEISDPIRLIKLDIEGGELPALRGAVETIAKHKPVLLVSVYHTWIDPEQIFTAKEFIESLNLGYEFQFKWTQPESAMIYEQILICYCKP